MSRAMRTAQERAAFRKFVRTHHPDIGGDPAVFITGLAALRGTSEHEPAQDDAPITFVQHAPRLPRRLRAWWGRRTKTRVH